MIPLIKSRLVYAFIFKYVENSNLPYIKVFIVMTKLLIWCHLNSHLSCKGILMDRDTLLILPSKYWRMAWCQYLAAGTLLCSINV